VLHVEGVDKAFGRTKALRSVTLHAEASQVHAVLGENGAGKSTLMKVLAGVIAPDAGSIELDGRAFAPANPSDARRAGVAIVYQEPQLCPHLTVAENVLLGLEPQRMGLLDRATMRSVAEEALAELGAEAIAPDALVESLPPGDQQMIAIARALAQGASKVLILDEPTSSLTSKDSERLFEAVAKLRERGRCILYISHFLEEVERIADRYTVLRDGKTVGSGTVGEVPMSEVVRLMVGSDVEDLFPRSDRRAGDPAMVVKGLSGVDKPTEASLTLHRGEVLGIAGLVGSGRTELLRAIFGLDRTTTGTVVVGTHEGSATPAKRLAQGVGMLSEDRKGEGLAASMSVADNLTLSRLDDLGPAGIVLPQRQRSVAMRWIERLGVKCREPEQPIGDLSGGNQQKVALARLLHHDVDVLLLDEPTRGIDVRSRAEVYRVIDELAAAGKAVLVVSSYLPELFGICDRIAVMRRGVLGPARPVNELDPHSVLVEATGA
jgi:ribose transport system ATP-binding protein